MIPINRQDIVYHRKPAEKSIFFLLFFKTAVCFGEDLPRGQVLWYNRINNKEESVNYASPVFSIDVAVV